jgi:hypothetical protein
MPAEAPIQSKLEIEFKKSPRGPRPDESNPIKQTSKSRKPTLMIQILAFA